MSVRQETLTAAEEVFLCQSIAFTFHSIDFPGKFRSFLVELDSCFNSCVEDSVQWILDSKSHLLTFPCQFPVLVVIWSNNNNNSLCSGCLTDCLLWLTPWLLLIDFPLFQNSIAIGSVFNGNERAMKGERQVLFPLLNFNRSIIVLSVE